MPRLPEVLDRDQLPEDQRDLFEYLAGTRGSVRVPFSLILNSPETARRISHLGTFLRFESSLPQVVTELTVLTTAREYDCRHEWAAHTRLAREAGISDSTIEIIGNRRPLTELSEEEILPVRFARELLQEHVASEAAFDGALERFGNDGVIELTATIGYYGMLACLLNAMEVIPPDTAPQLP